VKVKKGDVRVQLPDYGQVLGVVVAWDEGGERRKYPVNLVYHETIRRQQLAVPDLVGMPSLASISGIYLHIWPTPDRDCDVLIRYYPPEVEA